MTNDEHSQEEDLIENGSYVSKIVEAINTTSTDTSFSIGVFSTWGTGKTDFLSRLSQQLNLNHSQNIVIEFNPWKGSTPESVLKDFFSVISSALKLYNNSISNKIKSYTKKILSTSQEVNYKIIDTVAQEFFLDETMQEQFHNINTIIKQTGKRLIILIDDLDRMTGLEIMQMIGVIRNSANFSNTFFIVTLDHSYVINVLQKTNQFAKEEQYLNKIFQLVITLPKIRSITFSNSISQILITTETPIDKKDEIEKAISINDKNIQELLDNYRDVKRFCNAFKIKFNMLSEDVEVIDLFLLELIKTKSIYAYELIANETLLQISNINNYEINEDGWKYFKKTSNLDEFNLLKIRNGIKELLSVNKIKNSRQFLYPYNYRLYFCFQLFDLISLKEFNETIKLSAKEIHEKFNVWIGEKKEIDLLKILNEFNRFKDIQEFEKFLHVYLLDDINQNFLGLAKTLIMNDEYLIKSLFSERQDYEIFIRKLLNDISLPEYSRAYIGDQLLKYSIYNNKDLILPKAELQDIIYYSFDSYLNKSVGYNSTIMSFYLFNDETRDKGKIILSEKASHRLFEYLSIKENFDDYLKYFIRSYSQPNDGQFVFEPFVKNIFPNWETFKNIVEHHIPIDISVEILKPIIIKYIDSYIQGKDSFKLNDAESEIVLNHLRNTGQYFMR